MRSARTYPLLAAIAAVLVGCTSLPAEADSKTKRVCVNRREIDTISSLDDQHGFLKVGVTRFYLITLDKACVGFERARTIEIDDEGKRVCGDGSSLISFSFPAQATMRCRIERLDRVPDKAAAWDLINERKGPQ
jgi:hypothetical protein